MPDAYHIVLAVCLAASLCWLVVLLPVWIRMRDELRRERDHFRDSHVTTCRQLREAIEDGQAARAELKQAGEDASLASKVAKELRAAREAAERETMRWVDEVARLTTVLDQIGTLAHGSIGMESADCPPTETPGNPRAIAGQSGWIDDGSELTHRTDLGGWIPVGDALPDDPDEEVVALAGGLGGGFPALAHYSPSGACHDCYRRDLSGVTHWARWPESPDSPNA